MVLDAEVVLLLALVLLLVVADVVVLWLVLVLVTDGAAFDAEVVVLGTEVVELFALVLVDLDDMELVLDALVLDTVVVVLAVVVVELLWEMVHETSFEKLLWV